MLTFALVNHPEVSSSVLSWLAHNKDPYTAATARVRLGWDTPWQGLDLTLLSGRSGVALLNQPNLTEHARNELLTATPPATWFDYCRDPDANPDALTTIAHSAMRSGDATVDDAIITNPATPDTLVRQLLVKTIRDSGISAVTAIAIADNRGISPAELMPHCTGEMAALMNDYRRAGDLPTLLEQAPLSDDYIGLPPWSNIARLSSNEAVFEAATSRALDAVARPCSRISGGRLLSALLRNPHLPASTCATLLPRVYEHAHLLNTSTLTSAHIAACSHANATAGILDLAVSVIDSRTSDSLLPHPRLTAAHLHALAATLTPDQVPSPREMSPLQVIIRIGLHPNATREVRQAVRTHTPQFFEDLGLLGDTIPDAALDIAHETHRCGVGYISLVRAVHERPLIPAHLPLARTGQDPWRAALTHVITAHISQHPELLTDPHLARGVLALAPNHHDTFDNLISVVTEITSR